MELTFVEGDCVYDASRTDLTAGQRRSFKRGRGRMLDYRSEFERSFKHRPAPGQSPRGGSRADVERARPIRPDAPARGPGADARGQPDASGRGLPVRTTSLRWEVEHFFERRVGLRRPRRRPGERRAIRGRSASATEGILLVRDQDGEPARRSPTPAGTGATSCSSRAPTDQPARDQVPVPRLGLRAGRHAERRARASATSPGFDKTEYPLIAARVAEWHGWVFVNASGAAPPLARVRREPGRLIARVGARAAVRRRPARLRHPARTGRRSPRTTTSATTARASTRSCAR